MNQQNAINHHKFSKFFPYSATYLPIYHRTNALQSSPAFITIGLHTGQPLLDWIAALPRGSIWKYDLNTNVSGLETKPMKLMRLLGATLAPIHECGGYVGDILHLARVETDFSRITFDNYVIHPARPVAGIKRDIDDFRRLIIYLENFASLTNSQTNNCVASRLFKRLCVDAQTLTTLPELLEISYFVCHNPISWVFEQRIDFVFTYYSFRELDSEKQKSKKIDSMSAFDSKLKLDIFPTNFPLWNRTIPSNTVFSLILHDPEHRSSYKGKAGLMIYHRSCYLHYHKKEQTSPPTPFTTIDTNLSVMFPFALPMAWYAFYLRRKDLQTQTANLVTVFKKQPGLLYYKKFP